MQASAQEGLEWRELRKTITNLEQDPSYVLKLKIPEIPWESPSPIPHNLPLPEFDDTGYIGRTKDKADISKLILSHHQIVTIIGEGGVGKTAILVKSLYDILETAKDRFDAIAWASLKNQVLTAAGIQNIKNCITDTVGLVGQITNPLGAPKKETLKDSLAEIREYMEHFRVLIAIDNLETLQGGEFLEFLRDMPPTSKLVITSRVGLGELEIRRPLLAMDEKEAAQLFRRFSQVHAAESLLKLPQEAVVGLCRKLYRNPLIIRWYITSVLHGMPATIPIDKQSEVLDFCVRNVYDKLSNEARTLLQLLLAARTPLGQAELAYLSDINAVMVVKYIYEITNTMMIKADQIKLPDGSIETQYSLTEIARKYLEIHQRPPLEELRKVSRKLTELSSAVEAAGMYLEKDPYDKRAITIRSPNDRVPARLLQKALMESLKQDRIENALSLVLQAKDYAPTYPDVYKISAFIKVQAGDYYGAGEDYEEALQLSPDSPQILFLYAGFLVRHMKDTAKAYEVVQKAVSLDSDNKDIKALLGRILTFLGRYSESWTIFDDLLNDMEDMNYRSQIKTLGMGLDCLKRWVEHLNVHREAAKVWAVASQSFEYFDRAFEMDGNDRVIRSTMCEMLLELCKTAKQLGNSDTADVVVGCLHNYNITLSNDESFFHLLKVAVSTCRRVHASAETLAELARVLERYGIDPSSGLMDGSVVRVFPERGFGFIKSDDDGSEYYFRFNEIHHRVKWKDVKVNSRFQFSVGRNSSGVCAIMLEPI